MFNLKGMSKVAFFHQVWWKNLPSVAPADIVGFSDSNGPGHRVTIFAGAEIKIIASEECYENGLGGPDADQFIGLWVTTGMFEYNY